MAVAQQHRAAIFEMRSRVDPETGKLYTLEKIGATLGISKSLVNKELRRPASKTQQLEDGEAPGDFYTPPVHVPGPLGGDPEVEEARKRYELERVAAATAELRARRLESERRLELLGKTSSGDNGAALLVMEGLRELRQELASLKNRPAPAAAAAPPPSPLQYLGELKQGWETVQALAPAKPPSTAAELEMRVALDRLNLEREERMRKLDAEIAERNRQLENERIRSEAIAQQITTWGPLIAQGVQSWLAHQGGGNGSDALQGQLNPAPGPRPGLTVLTPERGPGETLGMVEGPCPSCGARLGIVGQQVERCPRCTTEVVVVEGRIWPKLPAESEQHFAS